jgi:hypothetical protein
MSTFFSVLFFLVGAFSFSFVLWKKLREDYKNEEIFKFTIFIFLGLFIGWWIALTFARSFSFWITILVPFIAGTYVHRRLGLRFFEIIDALAPAWFAFLFFSYSGVFLSHLINTHSFNFKLPTWFVLAEIALSLGSTVLYRYLLVRYRKFSWYPSGKVGFAGLASLGVYFIIRTLFNVIGSIADPTILFRLGNIGISVEVLNAIIGLLLAGVSLYVLYSRSGRK